MKTVIIISLLIVYFSFSIYCQEIEIYGKLTNKKGEALIYANVTLQGCFDGTTTDELGKFSFNTGEKGKQIIIASFMGFEPCEKEIVIKDDNINVDFVLKPIFYELEAVTITAGTFEASDEKRTVIMRSADIGTTAGALGDITGAIETLPGVQMIGESTGLFVRGGSGTESKIIIDEMPIQNPFYSPVPDIKQRGRFDPFMFSGTVFSSGGYSASYGQALSSTLVLKSRGLADSTNTGGGLYAYGANLFHAHRWNKTSIYFRGEYNNMALYHNIFTQITDWEKSPENLSGKLIFRHKFSKTDIFKFYCNHSSVNLAINYDNVNDMSKKSLFTLNNNNLYINSSYKKYFNDEEWSVFLGTSYSKDKDDAFWDDINMSEDEKLVQGKVIITNHTLLKATFHFGAEIQGRNIIEKNDLLTGNIDEVYFAGFLEANWYITNNLAARIGMRSEYSELLKKNNIAPRTSLSYKTGENSQISLAYGKFYQTPENNFLYYDNILNFENATHYITNYQWMRNKRTFRIELFNKEYDNLIKNIANRDNSFNNLGTGYARGIELFYRDKKSIPNADYWISYSLLDTERDYHDFPIAATPAFAAKHKVSFIYKHWVSRINSMPGFSYLYSSGRPYFNPSRPENEFHNDYTEDYHNIDINISKMTKIFGKKTVVYASIRNVLGQEHIFGYRYLPDGSGRIPIKPSSVRSFFIGCFISTY